MWWLLAGAWIAAIVLIVMFVHGATRKPRPQPPEDGGDTPV